MEAVASKFVYLLARIGSIPQMGITRPPFSSWTTGIYINHCSRSKHWAFNTLLVLVWTFIGCNVLHERMQNMV
jgi:hypothetical protein